MPLRFNEAQLKLYRLHQWFGAKHLPVRVVICKARRAGISTGVEAIIYDDTTQHANTWSLIVANEKNPSENVLDMCRRFWAHTPEWLVPPDVAASIGREPIRLRPQLPAVYRNNPPKDRIEFDSPLDSRIYVATARSIDAYLGYGFQNIHATEVSRYKDGHELFRSLYPTLSTDPHSALYMESTPNGQTGPGAFFHQQCMDAASRSSRAGEYGVTRLLFLPWHEMTLSFAIPIAPEKRHAFELSLTQQEKDLLRLYPAITLEQFNWRRMMLAGPTFNRDEDLFDQEYPTDLETAFLTSGTVVFGRKHIKRLAAKKRHPLAEGDIYWGESDAKNENAAPHDVVRRPQFLTPGEARSRGFKSHVNSGSLKSLKVYRWPVNGERVFLACDVGRGNPDTEDGDFSVIQVGVLKPWDRDELIMTWRGHLNPVLFAEVASALSWLMAIRVGDEVEMPMLAPEWTGPGVTMCTYIDQKNLYPNLYRYRQPGTHGFPRTKGIGWESNAKTKPLMVDWTRRMIERDMIDVPDATTILEMSTYREQRGFGDPGDYGGAAGRHDDTVSALEILCVLLRIYAGRSQEQADAIEVPEFGGDDAGDVPFDPFEEDGLGWIRDADEGGAEEALGWMR